MQMKFHYLLFNQTNSKATAEKFSIHILFLGGLRTYIKF